MYGDRLSPGNEFSCWSCKFSSTSGNSTKIYLLISFKAGECLISKANPDRFLSWVQLGTDRSYLFIKDWPECFSCSPKNITIPITMLLILIDSINNVTRTTNSNLIDPHDLAIIKTDWESVFR